MTIVKNTLSHLQYHHLCTYITEHAIDGKIELKPGELAYRATQAMGFPVTRKKAANTAREIGIELRFNAPRSNGAHQAELDFDITDVMARLDDIDKKINAIMKCFEVAQ